jgi:hypothetical protein
MSNSNARINAIVKNLNTQKVRNAARKVERLLGANMQFLFSYNNALARGNSTKARIAKAKMYDTKRRYENARKALRAAQNEAHRNTRAKFGNF